MPLETLVAQREPQSLIVKNTPQCGSTPSYAHRARNQFFCRVQDRTKWRASRAAARDTNPSRMLRRPWKDRKQISQTLSAVSARALKNARRPCLDRKRFKNIGFKKRQSIRMSRAPHVSGRS